MNPPERRISAVRLRILMVCVLCMFAALFARLWFLQVIGGPSAHVVAADNGVRYIYTPAPRGLILDRNGHVLVGNTEELTVDVDRQAAARQPGMLAKLAPLLGMTLNQLRAALQNQQYSPYAPVPVMTNPTADQVLQIQENPQRFPGVSVGRELVRTYSQAGAAAANIVGYVGRITAGQYKTMKAQGYRPDSMVGQTGIEAAYQSVLRGKPGVKEVEVDASGHVLGTLRTIPPVPGQNIRLTIDGTVQLAAVRALAQETAIKRTQVDTDGSGNYRSNTGAVVVEDPHNGQLLALATYPTYNPALFAGGITQAAYAALTSPASHYPLDDRALGGQYFPGSTFKLVTATAGLESGVITPTSLYHDVGGGITVGGHFFANDGHQSFGYVALPFAITVSDDAYFYRIGQTLYDQQSRYGTDTFQHTAYSYGFGHPTGLGLAG
ncbi:MAG TPA: penicillin-binding transpeptidase domain-containing protein, partial [Acidimicrobiales bacterium]|nr:penicillin-binding transpeptidase domain-containing protein [Acidimicrobiales bacterium]